MGRISRDVMFMEMARSASRRSTCHRLNVGTVITTLANRPVSVGWNGAASGDPHCAGNECPGIVPGACGTLHAEANALSYASKILAPGVEVNLYTTHSPCAMCSLLIKNHALYVSNIFFEIPYRSTEHLDMFSSSYSDPEYPEGTRDTKLYEVTPAGYVIDYFSRRVRNMP